MIPIPVLFREDVVEDGVDGGGEVVEDSGDVVEFLVDLFVPRLGDKLPLVLVKHDVQQPLRVERGPTDEESDDDTS